MARGMDMLDNSVTIGEKGVLVLVLLLLLLLGTRALKLKTLL